MITGLPAWLRRGFESQLGSATTMSIDLTALELPNPGRVRPADAGKKKSTAVREKEADLLTELC